MVLQLTLRMIVDQARIGFRSDRIVRLIVAVGTRVDCIHLTPQRPVVTFQPGFLPPSVYMSALFALTLPEMPPMDYFRREGSPI